MAQYEELQIDQGSDYTLKLSLKSPDGSKKDLTGHTITAWMKRNYAEDSSAAIKFTSEVISPPTDGNIALRLTNAQTDSLDTKRRYVYDIEMSYLDSGANTIIERIMEGIVTVNASVTK